MYTHICMYGSFQRGTGRPVLCRPVIGEDVEQQDLFYLLLVRVQNGRATLEEHLAVSHEAKHSLKK